MPYIVHDSVAYLMLFHIILLEWNNLPHHLFFMDKIITYFGIRLLLLHYWKQEFKATDEA